MGALVFGALWKKLFFQCFPWFSNIKMRCRFSGLLCLMSALLHSRCIGSLGIPNGISTNSILGSPSSGTSNSGVLSFMRDLCHTMQGDWDNYDQVVQDRDRGRSPGKGGGHEHMHCRIKSAQEYLPAQLKSLKMPVLSAMYYFNGEPNAVFRFRMYSFCPATSGATNRAVVEMHLWRFLPHVEARLRACGYDLQNFDWGEGDVAERIAGCDIYWAGSCDDQCGPGEPKFTGLMGENDEGTWIDSQNVEGLRILVKDDLKLWREELWVNDRGYDDSVSYCTPCGALPLFLMPCCLSMQGNFVYGNQRGVPYKLKRVHPGSSLEWTLGKK